MKAAQQFIEFYEDEDQANALHGEVVHRIGRVDKRWRAKQIPSTLRETLQLADVICGGDGAVAFVRWHVKSDPHGSGVTAAEAWLEYSQLIKLKELPAMSKRQFESRFKAAMLRECLCVQSKKIPRSGKSARGYEGFSLKRRNGSLSLSPSVIKSSDMPHGGTRGSNDG